jgi:AAHS family benzoate transporter-like MFS transporter
MPFLLIYIVAGLAGVGTFGGMTLVYSYIGQYYPASSRATALGWSAGVGRLGAILGPILGGFLVGAALAVPWGFYTFALAGLIAALLIQYANPLLKRKMLPGHKALEVDGWLGEGRFQGRGKR